ncbi:hypothetical protein Gpo141_00012052 [Globisporangium polare]
MRLDRIGSAASPREDDGEVASTRRRRQHETTRSSTSESSLAAQQRLQPQYKGENDDADHHTIVDMSLRTVRYVVVLFIGLGFSIAYAVFSFKGKTLRAKVFDDEGSSTVADKLVSEYSSISGPIMFAFGKILEFYCETLVFPTLETYLHNCSFFPGDQPQRVESKAKKNVLYWSFKAIFILINVGLASLYVSHRTADIEHNIREEDLVLEAISFSTSSTVGNAAVPALGEPTKVTDTVLKTVVSSYVIPFELNDECGVANQNESHPTIDQVESTSVSLGFPMNDWNIDVLPNGLSTPEYSIEFTYGEYTKDSAKYDLQASTNNLNVTLAIEIFVQGGQFFEQSVANADLQRWYECTLEDYAGRRQRRRLATSTEKDAKCFGVDSLFPNVAALLQPGNTTFANLVLEMVDLVSAAVPSGNANKNNVKLGFQKYKVTDQIMLETITVDVPLEGNYTLDAAEYDGTNKSVPVHFLEKDECGLDSCVFKSSNSQSFVRSEVSLAPFVTGCGVDEYLDGELYAFAPECTGKAEDAVMLYGLGSYITADSLELDSTKTKRKLVNPKAFMAASFGKLSWQYTDLSDQFNATCTDDKCTGTSMPLKNGDSELLAGKEFIADNHVNSSVLRPLRLLSLNPVIVPVVSTKEATEFTWNLINAANIDNVAPGVFGDVSRCDSLVDSYIGHIQRNHFYVEKPLQTMYTSALMYLFQNGIATELVNIVANDSSSGKRLNLEGTLEVKAIAFSVSWASAFATFIGCFVMCLLALAVIFFPTSRVKQSPNTTAAAQYVQILTDDIYPDLIHKKRLRFDNGDALLMNEYVVDNIVLHAKRDESKKIYL